MTDTIAWTEADVTFVASFHPDRMNRSASFEKLDPVTNEKIAWDHDNLPLLEIPVAGSAALEVPCLHDENTGLISWLLTSDESNAALAANICWWVEGGVRVGKVWVNRR